jgi:iron complex outermembrane receptor protein
VRRAYLAHDGTYVADGFLNGGPSHDFFGNHGENDTAPRYTVKYQILPDQMLYASAAKGFRIGGSNFLLGPVCNAALATAGITNGAPFKSDSLWSYEVGAKNSWFGGRVKSRLSVYRIDWKNIQQTMSLGAVDPLCSFNVTTNSGAAVSKGAEFEVDAAPLEHLTLNVAAGYEDAKITEATPGSLTVVGQPINEVPKWTGSATVQYSVPLGERSPFVRGQYTYSGSRTSFVNVLPPTGRPLNSYSLVNLRVGVDQGPTEVALIARNLFNEHAEIGDLAGESAELPGRPRWFIAPPRTIGLLLRRAF